MERRARQSAAASALLLLLPLCCCSRCCCPLEPLTARCCAAHPALRVTLPVPQALLVEAQAEQYLKPDEPSVTIPYRTA